MPEEQKPLDERAGSVVDPRFAVASQLALALAAIYVPGSQTVAAAAAVAASLEYYRQSTGRPAGWKPSPAEWDDVLAEAQTVILERERRIAELEARSGA